MFILIQFLYKKVRLFKIFEKLKYILDAISIGFLKIIEKVKILIMYLS